MGADRGIADGPAGGADRVGDARERVRAAYDADPERWPLWREVLLASCDDPNVVGVSNLLLAAARRSGRRGDSGGDG